MFIGTFYFFFFRIANNELHRNITWWIYWRLANEVFKAVFGLPTRHSERVFCSVSTQPLSWQDHDMTGCMRNLRTEALNFILLSEGIEAFYLKTSKYYAYKLPLG